MAESIAILFESVAWENLEKDLSKFSENIFGKNWVFPSDHSSQTLSLYEYDSWLNECEENEVSRIKELLGCLPKTTLCIELRRSNQINACEDAKKVCSILLNKHKGVVDDALDRIWTKKEIETDLKFLNEYRKNI